MATILGTAGNDTLTGGIDNDVIVGAAGADSITGGDGDDIIIGGNATAVFPTSVVYSLGNAQASPDTIDAGTGNDWIITFAGSSVDGGAGNDTLDLEVSSFSGANLNLTSQSASAAASTAFGGSYTNIETFRFWLGNGNDTFVGSSGNDFVHGGGGGDNLSGGAGNDTLYSGTGPGNGETILGGDGDDLLFFGRLTNITQSGMGPLTINNLGAVILLDGGAGNDQITTSRASGTVLGGEGDDTLVIIDQFAGGQSGVLLNLSSGDANAQVSNVFYLNATGFERFSITGSFQQDSFVGSLNADTLNGGGGNDTISAGAGHDVVDGGDGSDLTFGDGGSDNILGQIGDDILVGDSSVLVLSSPGTSFFFGMAPVPTVISIALGSSINDVDTLSGGDGNDWIVSTGGDIIDGGTGTDTLELDVSTTTNARNIDLSVDPLTSLTAAFGGTLTNVEQFKIWLGGGHDTLVGSANADVLSGGAGNDAVSGGAGNDTLFSGTGTDHLQGQDGDDVLYQATPTTSRSNSVFTFDATENPSPTTLDGGNGNDFVLVTSTGLTAIGGSGTDTLSLQFAAASAVSLDFSTGANAAISAAFGITATEFESFQLWLSGENDTVLGSLSADVFDGLAGNDSVNGRDGNDILRGGLGNDTLIGDGGNDVLDGGVGNDVLSGGAGNDSFTIALGTLGNDTITDFVAGTDTLTLTGGYAAVQNFQDIDNDGQFDDALITQASAGANGSLALLNASFGFINGTSNSEYLTGTEFPDSIIGGLGNDQLYGQGGNDLLDGGEGNDYLDGGLGDDVLLGGDGDDTFSASSGTDRFTGGNGRDSFGVGYSQAITTITDYQAGIDSINLPFSNLIVINNNIDIDGDSQADDVLIDYGTGLVQLLNTTLGPINGTSGDDSLIGMLWRETLSGGAGNDTLDGGEGTDVLIGGDGNDRLVSLSGADTLTGGSGADTFVINNFNQITVVTDFQLGVDFLDLPSSSSATLTNYLDLDNDGQFDDASYNSGSGAAYFLNNTLGVLNGTFGNDNLVGSALPDTISGLAGNDTLDGGAGPDVLNGGDGNDLLIGTNSNDTLTGGAGNDTFVVTTNFSTTTITDFVDGQDSINFGNINYRSITRGLNLDGDGLSNDVSVNFNGGTVRIYNSTFGTINGLAGADSLVGSGFDDTINGLGGNDTLNGLAGNDSMTGGDGNDIAQGNVGFDTIFGGNGDDQLSGSASAAFLANGIFSWFETADDSSTDSLFGEAGDDRIIVGTNDRVDGGAGRDTIEYNYQNRSTGGTFDVANPSAYVGFTFTTADNFEVSRYWLGSGNESVIGSVGDDFVSGGAGNDTLNGFAGNDTLAGGIGLDRLDGGDGNDVLVAGNVFTDRFGFRAYQEGPVFDPSSDTILGGNGNDSIYFTLGDVVDGGAGNDLAIVFLNSDTTGRSLNLSAGINPSLTAILGSSVTNMEMLRIELGSGNDTVIGSLDAETIFGYDGNDTLNGIDGDDQLWGGNGQDSLAGGSGNDFLLGESGNDSLIGELGNDTLSGGDGLDTLLGGDGSDQLFGDLGNDTLLSGDGNDTLDGGDGDDTLEGGNGNDYFSSGRGDDRLVGGAGGDQFWYGLNEGNDTITDYVVGEDALLILDPVVNGASVSGIASIGNNQDLDNDGVQDDARIMLTSGGSITLLNASYSIFDGQGAGNYIVGTSAGNVIRGFGGSDTLDGGAGADTLVGGTGDDYFYVDSVGDVVVELSGEGRDTIFTTSSYTLMNGNDVEVLAAANSAATTSQTLSGNEIDNQILAAAGHDSLFGGAGNDILYGRDGDDTLNGGAGADALIGGNGNDIYYVDSAFDSVQEAVGGGQDIVFTNVSFAASGSSEIEIIAAANQSSNIGLALGGNGVANQVLGTFGDDTLDGGQGDDALYGFAGNDSYYVDSSGDVVIEAVGGGADIIFAAVSYTLATGSEVEIIAAANAASTTGIGLVGNGLNNQLLGSAGGDTLNGDTGDDTLYGFGGNDIYYVDSALDFVVESVGGGQDTIFVSTSYSLLAGAEVEVLALGNANSTIGLYLAGNETSNQIIGGAGDNGIHGFDGSDTLYGLAGGDFLSGGLGNDYLFGGDGADTLQGGTGADWLIGGAGADVFKFSDATDSLPAGMDVITDFVSGTDKLDFSSFAGTSGPFTIGTLQAGSGPRIQIGTDVSDGYCHIYADSDGDGVADFELLVTSGGVQSLPLAGDFVL